MADVYSAVILDTNYWDGTTSWAGETSQANRDAKYSTRRYTSLGAWESARDGLASIGDVEYAVISGAWASADTSICFVIGWPSCSMVIECPLTLPDGDNPARHNGIYGNVANSYKQECTANSQLGMGDSDARDVTFDGLQCQLTYSTDSYHELVSCTNNASGYAQTIKNCIFKGVITTTVKTVGVEVTHANFDIKIENCIIYGFPRRGIEIDDNACTVKIYNCTVSGANTVDGIRGSASSTDTAKNCASFNNNDDFDTIDTIDYNASDDGDGTNAVDWTAEATDWAANFNDYANGDFTPLNVDLPGAGIGPGSDAAVPTTDIIGNARSGATCTIGAFEYQVGSSSSSSQSTSVSSSSSSESASVSSSSSSESVSVSSSSGSESTSASSSSSSGSVSVSESISSSSSLSASVSSSSSSESTSMSSSSSSESISISSSSSSESISVSSSSSSGSISVSLSESTSVSSSSSSESTSISSSSSSESVSVSSSSSSESISISSSSSSESVSVSSLSSSESVSVSSSSSSESVSVSNSSSSISGSPSSSSSSVSASVSSSSSSESTSISSSSSSESTSVSSSSSSESASVSSSSISGSASVSSSSGSESTSVSSSSQSGSASVSVSGSSSESTSISSSSSESASISNSSSSGSTSVSSSSTSSESVSTSASSSSSSLTPAGWLTGWEKRIKITLDKDQIDATLSDFPVPIYLSTLSGQTNVDVSCVFDELTSDANRKKIAITRSDGTTQCYVEIERWDDASEKAWLHTKTHSVSPSQDGFLYLYYDSAHADNTTYVGDVGDTPARSVWDGNFKAVYHLGEDPTGGADCIKDSISSVNDGTPSGSMVSGDLVDGQFGKCLDFDGSDDIVDCASDSSLDDFTLKTVEAIIDPTGWGGGSGVGTVVTKGTATLGANRGWKVNLHTGYSGLLYTQRMSGNDGFWSMPFTVGAIQHVAVTYDNGSLSNNPVMYKDGVSQTVTEENTPTGSIVTESANAFSIGSTTGNYSNAFVGRIDEVRYSSVIRSAAWIKATHKGLFDDLLIFSAEQSSQSTSNSSSSSSGSTSISSSSSSGSTSASSISASESASVSSSTSSASGSVSTSSSSESASLSSSSSESVSASDSSSSSESTSFSSSSSQSTSVSSSSESSESVSLSSSSLSSESVSSESVSVSFSSSSSSHDPIAHATTMRLEITPHAPTYFGFTDASTMSLEFTTYSPTYPLYGRMGQPIITGSKPKAICEGVKAYIDFEARGAKILMSGY